jgi:hypothetical protein
MKAKRCLNLRARRAFSFTRDDERVIDDVIKKMFEEFPMEMRP